MATTPLLDVVDVSDDHVRLSVERLPRSANRLGCRVCGLTLPEHGTGLIHRFVRPDLPRGHHYLDSVRAGDAIRLAQWPADRGWVRVAQLDRALVPNGDGLLWLRTAWHGSFLLHPATIVIDDGPPGDRSGLQLEG